MYSIVRSDHLDYYTENPSLGARSWEICERTDKDGSRPQRVWQIVLVSLNKDSVSVVTVHCLHLTLHRILDPILPVIELV